MRWRCWSRSCAAHPHPRQADVTLYVVAGIATAEATTITLEYWRFHHTQHENDHLATMYASVDRERK